MIKLVLTNEVIKTFKEQLSLDDDELFRLEKQKHLEFKINFSIIRCLNKNQVKATELLNASRTLDKEIMSQIHSGSLPWSIMTSSFKLMLWLRYITGTKCKE